MRIPLASQFQTLQLMVGSFHFWVLVLYQRISVTGDCQSTFAHLVVAGGREGERQEAGLVGCCFHSCVAGPMVLDGPPHVWYGCSSFSGCPHVSYHQNNLKVTLRCVLYSLSRCFPGQSNCQIWYLKTPYRYLRRIW